MIGGLTLESLRGRVGQASCGSGVADVEQGQASFATKVARQIPSTPYRLSLLTHSPGRLRSGRGPGQDIVTERRRQVQLRPNHQRVSEYGVREDFGARFVANFRAATEVGGAGMERDVPGVLSVGLNEGRDLNATS